MKIKKLPLLKILIDRYEEYSEKELYSFIICGEVKIGDETVREPRRKIEIDSDISISSRKWVSRGGEKLNHALNVWNIDVEGKVVLDAGASTGGFTDCLLQKGAKQVYSIDVGYNQLDYRLRTDDRVNVMERINIMSVSRLDPKPFFGVADLSFRSITGAASHILKLTEGNLLIALIKPQFELVETEGFDGIIRDRIVLYNVIRKTASGLEEENVKIHSIIESPIKGSKGNTEYLFQLSLVEEPDGFSNIKTLEGYLEAN